MCEAASQDKRNSLESTMGMGTERQSLIVACIDLRAMVIKEQEGADLLDGATRQRPPRDEIGNVVTLAFVDSANRSRGFRAHHAATPTI